MDLSVGRDLALIWLALLSIIFTLIPGVLFFFAIKALSSATQWLRDKGLPSAQHYTRLLATKTQDMSERVTAPVVRAETARSQMTGTIAAVPKVLQRRHERRSYAD